MNSEDIVTIMEDYGLEILHKGNKYIRVRFEDFSGVEYDLEFPMWVLEDKKTFNKKLMDQIAGIAMNNGKRALQTAMKELLNMESEK